MGFLIFLGRKSPCCQQYHTVSLSGCDSGPNFHLYLQTIFKPGSEQGLKWRCATIHSVCSWDTLAYFVLCQQTPSQMMPRPWELFFPFSQFRIRTKEQILFSFLVQSWPLNLPKTNHLPVRSSSLHCSHEALRDTQIWKTFVATFPLFNFYLELFLKKNSIKMSKHFHNPRSEPVSRGCFESPSNYLPSAGLLSLAIIFSWPINHVCALTFVTVAPNFLYFSGNKFNAISFLVVL